MNYLAYEHESLPMLVAVVCILVLLIIKILEERKRN